MRHFDIFYISVDIERTSVEMFGLACFLLRDYRKEQISRWLMNCLHLHLEVIRDCLTNIVRGFSAACLEAGGRPQSVSLGSDGEVTVCQRLGCLNYSDPDLCQQSDRDISCLPSVIFQAYIRSLTLHSG